MAFEVLGCSGRTVMTRGACTTSAWVVPRDWPGPGVPVASSVVSQHSKFSDFLVGPVPSEVLSEDGAENTKAVGVPPGIGASNERRGYGLYSPVRPFFFGN